MLPCARLLRSLSYACRSAGTLRFAPRMPRKRRKVRLKTRPQTPSNTLPSAASADPPVTHARSSPTAAVITSPHRDQEHSGPGHDLHVQYSRFARRECEGGHIAALVREAPRFKWVNGLQRRI